VIFLALRDASVPSDFKWLAVSWTCRTWRHIALHTTQLWTVFDVAMSPALTNIFLERAGPAPLYWHLTFRQPSPFFIADFHDSRVKWEEEFSILALQHARRIRAISIKAVYPRPVRKFLFLLTSKTPLLAELLIKQEEGSVRLPPNLFGQNTPPIHTLSLMAESLELVSPVGNQWLNVTNLTVKALSHWASWDPEMYIGLLRSMPRLTYLSTEKTFDDLVTIESKDARVHLKYLQELRITSTSPYAISRHFDLVQNSPLRELTVVLRSAKCNHSEAATLAREMKHLVNHKEHVNHVSIAGTARQIAFTFSAVVSGKRHPARTKLLLPLYNIAEHGQASVTEMCNLYRTVLAEISSTYFKPAICATIVFPVYVPFISDLWLTVLPHLGGIRSFIMDSPDAFDFLRAMSPDEQHPVLPPVEHSSPFMPTVETLTLKHAHMGLNLVRGRDELTSGHLLARMLIERRASNISVPKVCLEDCQNLTNSAQAILIKRACGGLVMLPDGNSV
jgi:hypothetical protein